MPGFPDRKFAAPIECWALIWWVDNDSEAPDAGGGYAVLQCFYNQETMKPVMLNTEALNPRVLKMMAYEAEKHRRDFAATRRLIMERRRQKANEDISGKIADMLQDAVPQFKGPTSFGSGGALPTVVQKKAEQIEKNLKRTDQWARRMGRGPVVRKPQEAEANGY